MAGILDVLLHLPLLPSRRRIAEVGVEEIVARHGQEPGVDLALLARTYPIHCSAHVVVNPAPRHAAQNPEGMAMSVEQHLVGLKKIRPDDEGPAMRQLGMGNLQLGPLALEDRPVLTPVELESFARLKDQRNEGSPPAGLLLAKPIGFPGADEG